MMKIKLLILLTIVLTGCESPPVRRAEIIAQHPDWDAQTVNLIREGFLAKGMTADQVRAAWGRPCYTCTGTVKDQEWDKWMAWEYQTQIVFFDENERVLRWTKK
jgi:outer membrane protein assembly factor BamE (lipoprotein component of BamABCDE complex)